ncbi:hypothetical protein FHL15_010549 [Xylaria flabelliformis]|uniref:Uncharacterized protein n=1 Tax=Xylaria flabelliformis TaxID=2512241 RepID=A0A553HKW6_9PEZI|nr:hypothetical protein FHL15_010549 [Xylaria flabelliformis]
MDETAATSADESDFYGDSDVVADMERRVEDFDVQEEWQDYDAYVEPVPIPEPPPGVHRPCPFEGEEFARQRTENVDSFLVRLPPSTTWATPDCSYIWITNPFENFTSRKDAQNQHVPGAEDEMPTGGDIATLMEGGKERLNFVSSFIEDSQKPGAIYDRYMFEQEASKAGADAAKDILELAQNVRVTFGKWLIPCTTWGADITWEIIAKATVRNELGIAAKVTARTTQDLRETIKICVYTCNFAWKEDVTRVAMKLKKLGVIKRNETLNYQPGQFTNPAARPFSRPNYQE